MGSCFLCAWKHGSMEHCSNLHLFQWGWTTSTSSPASQQKLTSQDPKNPIMSNQLVSAVGKSHFLVLCRWIGGTALLKKSADRLSVEFVDVVDGWWRKTLVNDLHQNLVEVFHRDKLLLSGFCWVLLFFSWTPWWGLNLMAWILGHPNSNHASRGHFCSGLNRLPIRDTTHPQTILSETSFVALKNGKPTRESSLFRVASQNSRSLPILVLAIPGFWFRQTKQVVLFKGTKCVDARHLRFGKWAACTCAWSAMRRIWSLTSCSRWKRQVPNSERAVNREWVPRQKRVKATFGSRDDEVLPILGIRFFTNQKFMEWDTSFSGSTASVPLPGFGEFSPVDSWSLGLL